ncbi:hypothetical protein F4821DRAFT_255144 [Hypoxylon rubiginosum]|uniref:Uncharacterized protein n=1 Tax=Hypoxylon rubiginosum TaxID=110542 RepID=A0ACC0DF52_9PEZI|nr:hypothetical protein F4821DRAFT_255144 [Hypoxylon rubiginosum]
MPGLISYLLIALITIMPLVASAALPSRHIDYSSLHCPEDPLATLATPTYGTEGAIFTVCTELVIAAAPAAVYAAVLDFRSYARWNTFVVDVALPNNISSTPDDVYVGMPMRFTSRGLLGDLFNATSTEVVSLLESPGAAATSSSLVGAWRYNDGVGGIGSRAEHPNVFVDLGNRSTRYVSYETYYAGLTTGTIALLREQLQDQWDVQARDLKSYVESL